MAEHESSIGERAKLYSDLREYVVNAMTYQTGLADRELDLRIARTIDGQPASTASAMRIGACDHYTSALQHTIGLLGRLLPLSTINMEVSCCAAASFESDVEKPTQASVALTDRNRTFNAQAINLSLALLDCMFQALIALEGEDRDPES